MRSAILLCAFAAAALTACSARPDPGEKTTAQPDVDDYWLRGVTVREFRLADGTRCVASTGGGVTCDWRRP